jgi:predicted DNA-binding transcriptional regulator YafY
MGKLSSILTMAELLNSGRKYSIKELSEILEVTPRMVRFYKEEMEKAGIYIDTIRGPYGGYILDTTRVLPSRGFSKYDIQLLNNLKKLVYNNEEFHLNKEFDDLIDKISGIYESSKKVTSNGEIIRNDEKEKYNLLSKAIKEKRKVEIIFLSASGEKNIRIIHPCDMFLYSGYWYVSAYCELRNEIRHFRLERILNYRILEERYC